MSRHEKLLEAIRGNPANVRFKELLTCVEASGFVHERTSGSHFIYRHPGPPPRMLSLQEKSDGKAKTYQVKQFLDALDALYPELDP